MILSGANWSCLSLTFNQCWSSKVECHQSLDSISFPQFLKGSLKCSSQLGKKKELSRTWIYVCLGSIASPWNGQISFWFMSVVSFTEITGDHGDIDDSCRWPKRPRRPLTASRNWGQLQYIDGYPSDCAIMAGVIYQLDTVYHMDLYNHSSPSPHNKYWTNRERERMNT